jgi:hypothetical protein
MNRATFPALPIAVALALSGCSEKPIETLVGCFSMDAASAPTLRIAELKDGYSIAMRSVPGEAWGAAQPMRLGDANLARQVLGADADKVQASLVVDAVPLALFRVEPKSSIAGGTADSGFLGSFFFGTGQVFKAQSCDQT